MSSPGPSPTNLTNGVFSIGGEPIVTYVDSAGESYSVSSETTESVTVIQWKNIITMLIALVGIVMLGIVIFQAWRERQLSRSPQKQTNDSTDDPENAADSAVEAEAEAEAHPSSPFNRSLLIIPLLATFLATILSITTHASCEMIDFIHDDPFVLSLGLWRARFQYSATMIGDSFPPQYSYEYVSGGECRSNFNTDDYEQDGPLVVARVAATLATVVGFFGFVFLVHHFFRATTKGRAICWLKSFLLLTTVAQLFSLRIMNTHLCSDQQDDCYLNFGTIAAILASYYWGLAWFALLLLV